MWSCSNTLLPVHHVEFYSFKAQLLVCAPPLSSPALSPAKNYRASLGCRGFLLFLRPPICPPRPPVQFNKQMQHLDAFSAPRVVKMWRKRVDSNKTERPHSSFANSYARSTDNYLMHRYPRIQQCCCPSSWVWYAGVLFWSQIPTV